MNATYWIHTGNYWSEKLLNPFQGQERNLLEEKGEAALGCFCTCCPSPHHPLIWCSTGATQVPTGGEVPSAMVAAWGQELTGQLRAVSRAPSDGLLHGPGLETAAHSSSVGVYWYPLARRTRLKAEALNVGSVQSQNDWSSHRHIRTLPDTQRSGLWIPTTSLIVFQGGCLKATLHTHTSWPWTTLKEG